MKTAVTALPQRRASRPPHRDPYFHRIADAIWNDEWDAILNLRTASDRERLFIEATILCKYGKSISLRGAPEKVRTVMAAARARPAPV